MSKKVNRGGRSVTQQEALERYFEGMPVVDAKSDYRIYVTPEDIACAIPGDPAHCGLAVAAARRDGATAVLIMREYSYVDLFQPDGSKAVERFHNPQVTRDALELFDMTGELPAGGFVLKKPSASETLEARRESRRRNRVKQRAALLRGETLNPKSAPPRVKPLSILVRDGTGMVSFKSKSEKK